MMLQSFGIGLSGALMFAGIVAMQLQKHVLTPLRESREALQAAAAALPASDSTQHTLEVNEWTQSNGFVDNPDDLR